MEKYNPKEIEIKWQEYWDKHQTFSVSEEAEKEKFYALIEFPYPSGAGLHVGHPRPFTAMDVISRKRRMQGFNVLYPIGFDAFGLPTENYAIKTGRPPAEVTAENIANFTRQLKALGFSFDWSRAVDTTDPAYYKWTQWLFLKFFEHGLAYKKAMPINWCLHCKIGLANEEVVNGRCERCGGPIEKRDKEQWMLAITKYADSLLEGLNEVDYIERAKVQQEHWIGRKTGINIIYKIDGMDEEVVCFTTRPDTNFGATFVVIGPEHPLVFNITTEEYKKGMNAYVTEAAKKEDFDRTAEDREKTGVFTGAYCINNLTGKKMPIWVADYVLGNVGTGAVVGVPGHDRRDFAFALKFGIPVVRVVVAQDGDTSDITDISQVQEDEGTMINSEFLNGMDIHEATVKVMDFLEEEGWGTRVVNYKLRDWVFSRQRYWGEPIPLVKCESGCGKEQVLILHGWEGSSQSDFFPALKKNLEEKGYDVFVFDAPHSDEPKFEEWYAFIKEKIKEHKLENFSVVGHSMGGHLAANLAQQHKLKQLVLVAPVGFSPSKAYFEQFADELGEDEIAIFKAYQNRSLDVEQVKKNVQSMHILFGDKDPWITKEIQDFYTQAFREKATIAHFPEYGHMSGSEGVTGVPEVETLFADVRGVSGWVPLPEDQLPLELPTVAKYEPTDTGESPLAAMTEWVKTTCPQCGGPARRETDTMPNWAGSSWYFLRYCDPHNENTFASKEALAYWMPVDWYNGGMEHTVLHLLYSRFWNQFLYDIGLVPTREPYKKRTSHGLILAEGGEKMSKSKGNVVNPDEMIERFSADALRAYIMFMGPFDQHVAWDTNGLSGVKRFLDRVWNLQEKVEQDKNTADDEEVLRALHKTIKKVSEDIDAMRFNTAVSAMMELTNEMTKVNELSAISYQLFVKILSPFAPHLCEELWERLGGTSSIAYESWPQYNEHYLVQDTIELVVQVNGKVRAQIQAPADVAEDVATGMALSHENVIKWLGGKPPKKIIFVKGKLISIVV